ncbi:ABC transporter permease [Candidatus Saccharibacteria bacterium]|jgi:putative ABC transport system permease protein|nr:ABC transporter permease [Candidatus Saccharibacteria bacterium]TXG77860.1 MAG: ABC transporter permease [Patescibacteria group bacterium]HPR09093.1 ABC transporter permease [Candidatus Saccharibacteria bacterium]
MMKRRTIKDRPTVQPRVLAMIAYRNLLQKRLRTLLTVSGIAIGIGSVYFLLSFGIGLQRLVANQVIGNQSIRTIDVKPTNSSIIKLDDIAVQRISEVPDVKEIGKIYYFPGSFKLNNSETDSIVYGIDKGYEQLTYLNLIKGELLKDTAVKNPIVMNKAALEAIGLGKDPSIVIGKSIDITVPLPKIQSQSKVYQRSMQIVGVIDSGSGAEIFIPSTEFRQLGVPALTQLKVGVDSVETVSKARAQIESIGLETSSPVDTLNEINKVFNYLNLILIGFGGIGMLIAILGMFNTLTISLLERTKEIGLMVALGARSVDMKRLFIFEALFLSLVGATLGIVGAVGLGWLINIVMNMLAAGRGVKDGFQLFAHPYQLVFGVIGFMVIVGLLVVVLPARRAQKISPIDALRRE